MSSAVNGSVAKIAIDLGDSFKRLGANIEKASSALSRFKFHAQGELTQIKVYRKTRSKQPRVVRVLKAI